MYRLPQGDFRPAETHRKPSVDQLQHKLAGVTTIVRQVIGKLDADAPLFCHDPHFEWRRACRKAVPEHRQPMSLGEVEDPEGFRSLEVHDQLEPRWALDGEVSGLG